MSEALIRDAHAALGSWLRKDGLPSFDTGAAVADAALRLYDEKVEVVLVYLFDAERRLISVEEVARGAETEATVSVRQVARMAILADAHFVVSVHNHPSGHPDPSDADKAMAERLDGALAVVGVLCLGHHVVARGGFGDIRTGKILRTEDVAIDKTAPSNLCPTCRQGWPEPAAEGEQP